jgi:ATP phosphoribosyltransferase regulatory subunit
MGQYAKITPEGTKDYLFEECVARATVQRQLTEVFERYGYVPVTTPHLEFYDVFRRPSADWLSEKLYSVTDSRGRLLVMRPDSTLPIARIAATRLQHAALPLRLCYHQSVFRRAQLYSGNNDETMQSGVELIGAQGLRADLEILSCAVQALQACDAAEFRIELGHAGVFNLLAEGLGADDELKQRLADAIEAKNLPALEDLLTPYSGAAAETLRRLPGLFGGGEVLAGVRTLFKSKALRAALDYLTALYDALAALGLQEVVDIDLGLVHGHNYYTGLVFRGYMQSSGHTVLSGGRYDALLAEFGRPAPAAGFGLVIDPLAEALLERRAVPQALVPDELVYGEAGNEAAALLYAKEQRAAGLRCEIAMQGTREEAAAYADARGIVKMTVVGDSALS